MSPRNTSDAYRFERRPGLLGWTVVRISDGANLGVILPVPGKKWTVSEGDGETYGNRLEAAAAMDRHG